MSPASHTPLPLSQSRDFDFAWRNAAMTARRGLRVDDKIASFHETILHLRSREVWYKNMYLHTTLMMCKCITIYLLHTHRLSVIEKFLYLHFLFTDFCHSAVFGIVCKITYCYRKTNVRRFYSRYIQFPFLRYPRKNTSPWIGDERNDSHRVCLIKRRQTSRAVINVINNSSVLSLRESRCSLLSRRKALRNANLFDDLAIR